MLCCYDVLLLLLCNEIHTFVLQDSFNNNKPTRDSPYQLATPLRVASWFIAVDVGCVGCSVLKESCNTKVCISLHNNNTRNQQWQKDYNKNIQNVPGQPANATFLLYILFFIFFHLTSEPIVWGSFYNTTNRYNMLSFDNKIFAVFVIYVIYAKYNYFQSWGQRYMFSYNEVQEFFV